MFYNGKTPGPLGTDHSPMFVRFSTPIAHPSDGLLPMLVREKHQHRIGSTGGTVTMDDGGSTRQEHEHITTSYSAGHMTSF